MRVICYADDSQIYLALKKNTTAPISDKVVFLEPESTKNRSGTSPPEPYASFKCHLGPLDNF